LEKLTLKSLCVVQTVLKAFSPVFAAGALPCLLRLEVTGRWGTNSALAFIKQWTALGPKIKLECPFLRHTPSEAQRGQLLKAVTDPAFCPLLRHADIYGIRQDKVRAALEERRLKREAQAAAAGQQAP
jgi:hypothetical protein